MYLGDTSVSGLGGHFDSMVYSLPIPPGYQTISHLVMFDIVVAAKKLATHWAYKKLDILCQYGSDASFDHWYDQRRHIGHVCQKYLANRSLCIITSSLSDIYPKSVIVDVRLDYSPLPKIRGIIAWVNMDRYTSRCQSINQSVVQVLNLRINGF